MCISKCNDPADETDYNSVAAPVNIVSFVARVGSFRNIVLTRGQRNLLEKLHFNPTQADSF